MYTITAPYSLVIHVACLVIVTRARADGDSQAGHRDWETFCCLLCDFYRIYYSYRDGCTDLSLLCFHRCDLKKDN